MPDVKGDVMPGKTSAADELEQLHEMIRQAHEVLGDLKRQEKQARETVAELIFGVVVEETNRQMTAAYEALKLRIKDAEDIIMKEFEDIREAYMMGHGSKLPTVDEFMIAQKVIEFIMDKVKKDTIADPTSVVTMTVVPRSEVESKIDPVLTTTDLERFMRRQGYGTQEEDVARIQVRPKAKEA